jgi:hypothetical protein
MPPINPSLAVLDCAAFPVSGPRSGHDGNGRFAIRASEPTALPNLRIGRLEVERHRANPVTADHLAEVLLIREALREARRSGHGPKRTDFRERNGLPRRPAEAPAPDGLLKADTAAGGGII